MIGGLRAVCDEMGAVLIRSAHSPNIKERRDCSTALFDAARRAGHAGRAHPGPPRLDARRRRGGPRSTTRARATSWILNDPFRGGTHLPDITLISPLSTTRGELIGFSASRAHHADVGGPTPGGDARRLAALEDEGVVIAPQRSTTTSSPSSPGGCGTRPQRLADLRAQRAANLLGAERLRELIDRDGAERRCAGWRRSSTTPSGAPGPGSPSSPTGPARRATCSRAARRRTRLELRVQATIDGDGLELDFSGSADQVEGNLNCPLAVTKSAAFFAVARAHRPRRSPVAPALTGPSRSPRPRARVLNARPGAAVAAGNVETSSRVADLVFAALGERRRARAGPGHDEQPDARRRGRRALTYYETLGGGQGACRGRRRAERHPRRDVEHAEHAGRGARDRIARCACASSRVRRGSRRRRGAPRRRRDRPRDRGARADALHADHRAPPPRAPRAATAASDGEPGAQPRERRGDRRRRRRASWLAGDRLRIETPGGGGHGTRWLSPCE